MKPAKIVSIEELWRRSKEKSAGTGPGDGSETAPNSGPESTFPPGEGNPGPDATRVESIPEVRFEKIIEAKKRIRDDYYKGDHVGVDILRAIFSDEVEADEEGRSPRSDGDED